MWVELRDPGDLLQLQARAAREPDAKQRDRYRAVLIAAQGLGGQEQTRDQIALATGRARQFVDEWVGRYRRLGLPGLEPRRSPGRPSRLRREQKLRFKDLMTAGPTEADGGACTLRGKDAKRIIELEFGKPVSLSRAYEILHEVGLSHLRPRPRHRKNDPEAMRLWKESAPLVCSTTAGRLVQSVMC